MGALGGPFGGGLMTFSSIPLDSDLSECVVVMSPFPNQGGNAVVLTTHGTGTGIPHSDSLNPYL